MNIGAVIICLCLALAVAVLARAAVRIWRNQGLEPANVPMVRIVRMSEAGRHAAGRAVVPFTCVYLALLVLVGAAAARPKSGGGPLTAIAFIAVGLLLLSWLLFLAVAWFNWPRLIVPPHLRSDVGLITGW